MSLLITETLSRPLRLQYAIELPTAIGNKLAAERVAALFEQAAAALRRESTDFDAPPVTHPGHEFRIVGDVLRLEAIV